MSESCAAARNHRSFIELRSAALTHRNRSRSNFGILRRAWKRLSRRAHLMARVRGASVTSAWSRMVSQIRTGGHLSCSIPPKICVRPPHKFTRVRNNGQPGFGVSLHTDATWPRGDRGVVRGCRLAVASIRRHRALPWRTAPIQVRCVPGQSWSVASLALSAHSASRIQSEANLRYSAGVVMITLLSAVLDAARVGR